MTDSTSSYQERYAASLMNTFGPPRLVLTRGAGSHVWDADGREYVDLLGGIAVNALGHGHPALVDAVSEQLRTLGHVSNFFTTAPQVELAEKLLDLLGVGAGAGKVFFTNSGTEANEAAFKLTRRTGRTQVVAAEGSFHGRTMGALALTAKEAYRAPFEPLPGEVTFVPYGDADALAAAVTDDTAAVLLEPIQGEAGVVIPKAGYFPAVRELCTANNITLVLDEIQTGLGRTGKLLAEQHEGIEADVTLVGKALSGGFYPVSAVLSNSEVLGVLQPGQHGSTFGGNPLACAIARAALRVLTEEGMVENSAAMGDYFMTGLKNIRSNIVKEVRGRGLMLAVELHPEAGGARKYCYALKDRGLLAKDTHGHTIRIAPPLVVAREQIDWALEQFDQVLTKEI